MTSYSGTTTLNELFGSGDSIYNWASQRQEQKNQMAQQSNAGLVSQMEADSDNFLQQSLASSDPATSKKNSAACNLNDLAIAMDKWRFQNRGVHIDKNKYPTANAIATQWIRTFPNDETHVNNCINGKTDLPTTLQRIGITLTDEDRQMLEEKNQMSMSNRKISFDPNLSTRSVLTPQNNEANDNLLPHYEPTSFGDADSKVLGFAKNLVGSLWNLGADFVDIFANLEDTASTLAKLPVGAVNNISGLDDELDSMTEDKLYGFYEEANEIADGLGDYLLERYWGTDENGKLNDVFSGLANLGDTLYKDPAGVVSDVMGVISGGAGLTKNALKGTKYAEKAAKIQKIANAADPINIIQHPIKATKAVGEGAGKAWKFAKNTDVGKSVANVVDKIGDYVVQSDKVKSLKGLVDTKVGKFLFPEAKDLYKKIAPMSDNDIAKFETTFGEKYGDYLNRQGVKGTPAEIVDQLQFQNDRLYKESTNAFREMSENGQKIKITDPKEAGDIRDMLAWNIQNQYYLDPHNIQPLNEMQRIYNNFLSTGEIDPIDFLTQKRYFERKSKFTYANPNNYNPEKRARATNIDSTAREIMLNYADANGYENLRKVNEQIRKNRSIIDGMGKTIMKDYPEGTIGLSDLIYAAASFNEKALARLTIKGIMNTSWMNNLRLNWGNKLRGVPTSPWEKIDMDEIRKVNAQNRIQDAYDFAMGNGTPRLLDTAQGGVVATDNMNFAKMRDADAIADAERILETYAHSPWDVEKKVVEWKPTSKTTAKGGRTVTQKNIFDSLLE